ncbi:MAG: tRNA lysidine(34) synthetase TilS [Candidatus Nomurabacteria bacterium]|nr:tRNA lysidine(34) synthetase TilS [Candidatus Nomurabacteria bacterium]
MKYILAISGGVDSVVLLDKVVKCARLSKPVSSSGCLGPVSTSSPENFSLRENIVRGTPSGAATQTALSGSTGFIVAHFDHGIRAESGNDADFVRDLAKKYGLEFILGEGNLGRDASEELARIKRYEFLRGVAEGGKIVTAHHADDLLETVIINLIRGTGWRGLAPFWSSDILRPLLGESKAEIVRYAIENNLQWVEDETNYTPKYLRNRVRDLTARLSGEQRRELRELYTKQANLRAEIEQILATVFQNDNDNHYHYQKSYENLPGETAIEILNKMTYERLTHPQLGRLRAAIASAKSGDIIQPGGGLMVGIYQGQISISDLL